MFVVNELIVLESSYLSFLKIIFINLIHISLPRKDL
jgi:hypothetical protein